LGLPVRRSNDLLGCVVALALSQLSCGAGASGPPRTSLRTREPDAHPVPSDARADQKMPSAHAPVDSDAFHAAFLVHGVSGQVSLQSATGSAPRVLIPHADLAIYDPALELLWYLTADRLQVFDLRDMEAPPVLVARNMPDISRLVVKRGQTSVSSEDGCDAPFAKLTWSGRPKLEAFSTDEPAAARIEGRDWLRAQLERPARPIGPRRDFTEEQVELPASVLDCEMPEMCATVVDFGAYDWQLVLVRDAAGGDCWNRGCLLRDPHSKLYASPPTPRAWSPATSAAMGPCGLYFFDEKQTLFLVNRSLCRVGGDCQEIGGEALGWLVPGDVVGAVGDVGEPSVRDLGAP
jgi:hypothetical protein